MMEWRPNGYEFDAKNLVRALFSEDTDEGKLLKRLLVDTLKFLREQRHGTAFFG